MKRYENPLRSIKLIRLRDKLLDMGTLEIDANFLLSGHPNGKAMNRLPKQA